MSTNTRRPINRWVRGTRAAARAFRMEWSRTHRSVGYFLVPLYGRMPRDEKWSTFVSIQGGGGGGGGRLGNAPVRWVK